MPEYMLPSHRSSNTGVTARTNRSVNSRSARGPIRRRTTGNPCG